jgi:hypothetical protein
MFIDILPQLLEAAQRKAYLYAKLKAGFFELAVLRIQSSAALVLAI